jgi:hypothetical protein
MIGLLKGRLLARNKAKENHQNQQSQSPKSKPRQTSLSESLVAAAATTERVQNRLAEISELQRAESNTDETNSTANADLNWSDNDDDNDDNDSDDNSLLDFSNRSLSSSEEESNSESDSGSQRQHQRQDQQEQEPSGKSNNESDNGSQHQRQQQQSSTNSLSSRDSSGSLDELSQLAPPPRATMIRADLLELSNISSAYTRSPSPDNSTTSSSDGIYYNHHHQHNAHWQQQRLLPASRSDSMPQVSSFSAYPYEDRPANLEMDVMTTTTDFHSLSPSQRRRVLLAPLQNQPKQHPHYHDYDDYNDSSHGELSLADQADYDDVLQRALLPDHPTRTISPRTTTARPMAVRVPWKSPWMRHSDPQTTSTSAAADADVTTAKSTLTYKQHTVDTIMKTVAYVGLASSFAVAIWAGTTATTTCTMQTSMTCWWTVLATAATAAWSLYILYVQYQVAKMPHLYREQVALQQTLQRWKCTNTHERSRHMAAQAGIQRWKLLAGVPAGDYEQNGSTTTAATVIPTTTTTTTSSSPSSPTTTTPSSPSSPTIITASIRRRHTVATELLAAKRNIRHHQRSQIAKAIVEVLIHKKNAKGAAWEKDGCVWNMRSIRWLELRILKIKGVRLDNVRLMAWWESQRQQELSSTAVVSYLIRSALLEEKNGFFVFESIPATVRRNTLFTSTSASTSTSTISPKPNRRRRRSSTSSSTSTSTSNRRPSETL